MSQSSPQKEPPLETGLRLVLHALENQIHRRLQRDERVKGVKKWEPLQEKVEELTGLILDIISGDEIMLETLLVSAQAFPKALRILCDDLGVEGLGEMRTAYMREGLDSIQRECFHAMQAVKDGDGGELH